MKSHFRFSLADLFNPEKSFEGDYTNDALLFFQTMRATGERFGAGMVLDVLRGSTARKILDRKFEQLDCHGCGSHRSIEWWKSLFDVLRCHPGGYITEEKTKEGFSIYRLGVAARSLLTQHKIDASKVSPVKLVPTPAMIAASEKGMTSRVPSERRDAFSISAPIGRFGGDQKMTKLYQYLVQLREEEAKRRGIPPYLVFETSVLESLARIRPTSEQNFRGL